MPNAVYIAVLYDSSDVARFTMLSQFFVDPEYFQSPANSTVQVAGAGTPSVDGIFTYRNDYYDKPAYTLTGQPDPDPPYAYSVFWASGLWIISGFEGDTLYFSADDTDYPWEVSSWTVIFGNEPVPTVNEYFTTVSGTWEQLTLSNQAAATVGLPFQWNSPFWNVTQTKQYVNSVVGDGTTPYASASVAGKTKLDTAPASASSPIAIGVNSATITTIQGDITSLNTLKAPKASPTFTGTVTVTGNITATTTIAATGNVTGANLSGTNTGNVTLSGENYISLTGQAITANAVNLSGTNVTGTLAAARMPALTGDVTTSAGAVATTIANLAVTNAKVATGIDAIKIADGSVSNAEFQRLDGVTSAIQTQIDAKAGLVSPSFTTPALGTVASGVLTACTTATASAGDSDTSLASTAFVQGLGSGAKVYRATVSQTSTSAPVATVITNTLGGTLVWARTTTGIYTATLSGVFTANKTQIFIGNEWGIITDFSVIRAARTSTSVITLTTSDVDMGGTQFNNADDILVETGITIVVGP